MIPERRLRVRLEQRDRPGNLLHLVRVRVVLLTVAAVIGAVSSHMPGRYRYYSLLYRRVVGSREKD